MFSISFVAISISLALSRVALGDVIIVPALGIANGGVQVTEDDVQPFIGFDKPCGTIDPAKTIDTSTPVEIADDNTISVTGVSFAALADGSTSVTATVDTTGTGNNFLQALQIQQNGNAIQAVKGTQQDLVAVMPDNTTCTGGQSGNLCLVQFMTAGGFSNCVVVSQGSNNTSNNTSNKSSNNSSSKSSSKSSKSKGSSKASNKSSNKSSSDSKGSSAKQSQSSDVSKASSPSSDDKDRVRFKKRRL